MLLLCASCGTLPPPGSLERLKYDQRRTIAFDCRLQPERYGFPYTGEEYRMWHADVGRWMPDLDVYCTRVARLVVK